MNPLIKTAEKVKIAKKKTNKTKEQIIKDNSDIEFGYSDWNYMVDNIFD